MEAPALLREQVQGAHDWMEATMADVTRERAHWAPPGRANPLGACYAHVLVAEDLVVQGMCRQAAPLLVGPWAGRSGLSEPPPVPGPGWDDYGAWTRRVRVDLSALRAYGQAVYAATGMYLAGLSPADLDRPLDLRAVGMGEVTLGWALSNLLLGHIHDLMGEISCLKGLQGASGYPF